VTIRSNPGKTENSKGRKTYIATKIITNAPVIFMTRNMSRRNVGIGSNIIPRISMTATASIVLLFAPKMDANLDLLSLAISYCTL
jgi:hypothetical protein